MPNPAQPRPRPQPSPPTQTPKPASNGGTAFTADAVGQAAAQGVAQALMPFFTQMLPNMLAQVVAQAVTPLVQRDMCAPCLIERLTWEAAHKPQLEVAHKAACDAAGVPEGDPRAQGLDVTPFLPMHLRGTNTDSAERMPQIQNAVTTIDGKRLCPGHAVPNVGGPRLLAVTGTFSPAMLGPMR